MYVHMQLHNIMYSSHRNHIGYQQSGGRKLLKRHTANKEWSICGTYLSMMMVIFKDLIILIHCIALCAWIPGNAMCLVHFSKIAAFHIKMETHPQCQSSGQP